MAAMDHQLGVKAESTYGTAVTVDRFYEFNSETIEDSFGRVEGDPLRGGSQGVLRSDRHTPYYAGASGSIQMDVLSKGFGFWFGQMLGAISTGTVTDSKYIHTATMGELYGDSFTCQVNRPLHPSGTNQAFTFEGGKITDWELSNDVEGNLVLDLGTDFEQATTATGLATASYPSGMENFTFVGGVITIGGSPYDITKFSVKGDNGLDTDRRQIRGNADKKEPTASRREISWAIEADFDSLAQRNRAAAVVRATNVAAITATWTAPTLIGVSSYPTVTVTIPAARFDEWKGSAEGTDAIKQELTGVARFDGTNSAITIAYGSADSVA